MRSTNQIVPVAAHKKPAKHRRKHRRVRSDWSGCKCPEGSEYRHTPRVTRGWTCLKPTKRGPRFVRAVCDVSAKRLTAGDRKMLPESTLFGVSSNKTSAHKEQRVARTKTSSSEKKRPKGLTGAACACPEGASRVKTKHGSRCHKNGKFVKTACVTGG